MNTKTLDWTKIRLLLFSLLLLLGIFLLVKPEKNPISSIEKGNVSVTVIQIKDKSALNIEKILGVILILSAVFAYYSIFKTQATRSKNRRTELTPQEKNICRFIKEGYSNKEIAAKLNVSVSTIKTHINNIYKKEGISSRKELIDNQE